MVPFGMTCGIYFSSFFDHFNTRPLIAIWSGILYTTLWGIVENGSANSNLTNWVIFLMMLSRIYTKYYYKSIKF